MARNLEDKIPYLITNRNKIPPWGLHLAYRVYLICVRKSTVRGDKSTPEALPLKQTLSVLDGRWKAAGTYLKLIEAREAMGIV